MVINAGLVIEVLGHKYHFRSWEDLEVTFTILNEEWGSKLDSAPPKVRLVLEALDDALEARMTMPWLIFD